MELISKIWIEMHSPVGSAILLGLLSISEILGTFERFKSSSVFGFVVNVLKKLKEKLNPQLPK